MPLEIEVVRNEETISLILFMEGSSDPVDEIVLPIPLARLLRGGLEAILVGRRSSMKLSTTPKQFENPTEARRDVSRSIRRGED